MFAELYVNWDYRTLAGNQGKLAAISVGSARLTERQAAAQTARDTTLTRARVWNRGSIVTISREASTSGVWVVVTRERTGGANEYASLPAGYHVTLAKLAHSPAGWAVSAWEPQS